MQGAYGPGTQLNEAQLATKLAVSRGPVREAMQRLVQEGLLVNRRHRGVFVCELTADDIVDIYLARGAIERVAARIVAENADPASFARLHAIVEKLGRIAETAEWSVVADVDAEFHRELVDASGSKRLIRMFRTLLTETRMCMSGLEWSYTMRIGLVDEHRDIVRALETGTPEEIVALIDAHMASAVEVLRQAAQDAPAPASS
jgi:DNA-binding GntR family transcriptional regulator